MIILFRDYFSDNFKFSNQFQRTRFIFQHKSRAMSFNQQIQRDFALLNLVILFIFEIILIKK